MPPARSLLGRAGVTLVPPKTLACDRTRVHIVAIGAGDLRFRCVLVVFSGGVQDRKTPLHRPSRIAQDAYMSTTGEAAGRAVVARTGVTP